MVEDWEKFEMRPELDEKDDISNIKQSEVNCNSIESENADPINSNQFNPVGEITKKNHMKKYALIVCVVVVAGILIMVSLWSGIFNINPEFGEVIAKYSLRDSGPTINLQSSSTGSLSAIPDENYFATYGYYMNGDKIGQAITSIEGQETYQGVDCYEIRTPPL